MFISSSSKHAAHAAGPILNDPTVDKTPDPESCQLFCQTVAECTYFSWADGDYSWEIYALGWVAGDSQVLVSITPCSNLGAGCFPR